jgi:hypothetical protein
MQIISHPSIVLKDSKRLFDPWTQFGKAIVCSDAAAEAALYGFTAVDRPEGYLVLAVASLGKEIQEITGTPGSEVLSDL